MRKRSLRKITGSLLSAAMLAASVCGAAAPASANTAPKEYVKQGGELLGATDFDDGRGLPWHVCETAPAKQRFSVDNGAYNVTVISNGAGASGRWDLQFRHRGLSIESGRKYYVHAEITCSEDGYIFTRIGNYAASKDYWNNAGNGSWAPIRLKKGETYVIDTTFVAGTELDPVSDGPAEWAFHYADQMHSTSEFTGEDTGVPEGAVLTFDNMHLQEISDRELGEDTLEYGAVRPKSNVRVNQTGYFANLAKKASYTTDAAEPLEFDVFDKSGKSVYSGKASKVISGDTASGTPETVKVGGEGGRPVDRYKDSGKYVQILDFTDIPDDVAGDGFYIVVKDSVGVSGTQFSIYEGAFDTTIEDGKVMWTNWKTKKSYQMNKSHPFSIKKEKAYGDLVRDAASYYYQNRSGVKIDGKYIKNGDDPQLAHEKFGHDPDKAYVQPNWVKSYNGKKFDGDTAYSVTATGGWYEADNHGKSVVSGGSAVWTLQNLYETSKKLGTASKWDDGKTMTVPEDANGAPDILDEARFELEWFFKMIVGKDDPYWGDSGTSAKATGLVYHKLRDSKWTDIAIYAWDYGDFGKGNARVASPPTYAATFNTIACAAQAARLWKDIDDDFAATCLEKAESCLAAAEKHIDKWAIPEGSPLEQDDVKGLNKRGKDPLFAPLDQAMVGEAYGDTFVEDDYYWALCELYATTGKPEYYEKLKKYVDPNDKTGCDKAFSIPIALVGGDNSGSFSSFNRGSTSGYGTLSLYLNSDKLAAEDAETVKASILKAADDYVDFENGSGMGVPYKEAAFDASADISLGVGEYGEAPGYEKGSNAYAANNAIVMAYAYDATKNYKYADGVASAMDYLLGRNGNDFSYVTGYGDKDMGTVVQYPRHTYWAAGVDPYFPKAPAGVLSGGPSAGKGDAYLAGLGYKTGALAPQKNYADSAEAWSVNGAALDWNAPLLWTASFLEDIAPSVTREAPADDVVWGDVDGDGQVLMNDVVLLMQSISNADRYGLEGTEPNHITDKGQLRGDVESHGNGLTPKDALQIQKWLLKLVDSLKPAE